MHPFFDLLSPQLFFSVLSLMCLVAVFLFVFGERLGQSAAWFAVFAVSTLVLVMSVYFWVVQQPGEDANWVWKSGWIWSREDVSAIVLGFRREPIGVMSGLLTVWLSLGIVLTLFSPIGSLESSDAVSRRKSLSAILLSCAGSVVSCLTSTPWLGFVGVILGIFAGAVVLGQDRSDETESYWMMRYFSGRFSGLIIALLGCSTLLGTGIGLGSGGSLSSASLNWGGAERLGVVLFLGGLFIQSLPFPFLGSDRLILKRVPAQNALAFVLPAWSALVFGIQTEELFRRSDVLEPFGWFALAFSGLAAGVGVLQTTAWRSLRLWTVSAFSLLWAIFAFAGAEAALLLGVGLSVGTVAFELLLSDFFEQGVMASTQSSQRKSTVGVGISPFFLLAIAAATGVPGFASASGVLKALAATGERPLILAGLLFGLLTQFTLGWRTAWLTGRNSAFKEGKSWYPSNATVISVGGLLLVSMAVWWSGNVSGGALPPGSDQLFPAVWARVTGHHLSGALSAPEFSDWGTWVSVYVAVFALPLSLAFWISGRAFDRVEKMIARFPRTSRFVLDSYGLELSRSKTIRLLDGVSTGVYRWVDERGWDVRIPEALVWFVNGVSRAAQILDVGVTRILSRTVMWIFDIGGRGAQYSQNGNIQFYITLAVILGLLVVLQGAVPHFMK